MDNNEHRRYGLAPTPPTPFGRTARPHPRHRQDAVRPAALIRQEIDRRRPHWLSDDAKMPSQRVWTMLTEGPSAGEDLKPWAAFQTVLTGLANAAWSRVHVERALHEWRSKGTPGEWWLDACGGRERQFDRAWLKALARVQERPAEPTRASNVDPRHDDDVVALLNQCRQRIIHDAFLPNGHRLLSTGKHAVEERVILYALDALAREHVAALPLSDDGEGVLLAASARSLSLITNWSQRPISRHLRALCGLDGSGPGRRTLLARVTRGTRGDASTYVLRPGGQIASRSQVSSLSERSMSNVALVRSVSPPDMLVLQHDLFARDLPSGFSATPVSRGLGQMAALVTSLLAANSDGLPPHVLATVAGTTQEALEPVLNGLLAFGRSSDRRGPVLIDEADDRLTLASTHVDSLVDDLDTWAEMLGFAGILQARTAQVESERRNFHEGKAARRLGAQLSDSSVVATATGLVSVA